MCDTTKNEVHKRVTISESCECWRKAGHRTWPNREKPLHVERAVFGVFRVHVPKSSLHPSSCLASSTSRFLSTLPRRPCRVSFDGMTTSTMLSRPADLLSVFKRARWTRREGLLLCLGAYDHWPLERYHHPSFFAPRSLFLHLFDFGKVLVASSRLDSIRLQVVGRQHADRDRRDQQMGA